MKFYQNFLTPLTTRTLRRIGNRFTTMYIAYIKGTAVHRGLSFEGVFRNLSDLKTYFKHFEDRRELTYEPDIIQDYDTLGYFEFPCTTKDVTLCVQQVCDLDLEIMPILQLEKQE